MTPEHTALVARDSRRRSAMHKHPLYFTWFGMKNRCRNPNNIRHKEYGGRGIKIDPMWLHFWTFVFDMGERPAGHQLDRIDNNGHYCPQNCRWATPLVQRLNSRRVRWVTYKGETLCQTDWAKRLGLSVRALAHRLNQHGDIAAIAMGPPDREKQTHCKRGHPLEWPSYSPKKGICRICKAASHKRFRQRQAT